MKLKLDEELWLSKPLFLFAHIYKNKAYPGDLWLAVEDTRLYSLGTGKLFSPETGTPPFGSLGYWRDVTHYYILTSIRKHDATT